MKSKRPKVLHPLAGRPLLQHVLNTARLLNTDSINVVIGHGAQQIEEQFKCEDTRFVLQAEQLGTGHAVAQTVDYLRDEAVVLILYGDVPLINANTLERLVANVDNDTMALLTIELDDPSGLGRIIRDDHGQVSAIVEHKDASTDQLLIREINTGIMALKGEDLKRWLPMLCNDNSQGEYYLTDIIALAKQQGKIIKTEFPDSEMEVLGINNHQQQVQLERYYQQHLAQTLMQVGVTLLDPQRFDCRGTLSAGEDVMIDINCLFEGDVRLGNNVVVGANCIIKDATIGDNVVIKPYSMIDGADVDDNCEIGPFARLRPETKLKSGAKIGNFVETKKTTIGEGSKVNHLSYVGDAEVGKSVNVGAGTITCNYDGVNKFKTEIGDGAFIGSNSALVAPVKIGSQATVGAGSTITKNVNSEQLSIARGKQRNIEGWKRPKKSKD